MLSIGCARGLWVDARTGRNVARLLVVAMGGVLLAACAQSSVVTRNSEGPSTSRQASLPHDRSATNGRVASIRKHSPFVARKDAAATPSASHGIASFYSEGTRTASGEKFDASQLTAAHPTLPFGTKLRVTNVATGQAVTVRVNDRGPYVPGRIVDVSYSAAETLGMVDGGLARVKLDVVQ
ncbi:septal ring lytic transglycosylase RlpA family protein [Bradyrhizobium sediminis]|uniref:Endolytic peptidoglycan transglycosylase RlpA n=2 Tax=Bradyrhizobium sediminis TaxID=2840469 RepID=A0A975RL38_9BRAD|nr:septal ring lytic transglycosylase RlpA family protein [Bradyrhizobium sediminis]